MIIITGANGFIGKNLYFKIKKKYNAKILIIEDTQNYIGQDSIEEEILDFRNVDFDQFAKYNIQAIFHLGAITDTTYDNFENINNQNTIFSIKLLNSVKNKYCKFIYASSASVYGKNYNSKEEPKNENPINMYSKSKLNFDNYVRENAINFINKNIYGLRYFNVYGPGENNKGKMASVVFHFYHQLINDNKINLFVGSDGFEAGEQKRDFIYVDDVTNITLDLFESNYNPGIYNLGTGEATSFNKVAKTIIEKTNLKNQPIITYIDFPKKLLDGYQSFTKADLNKFKSNGLKYKFTNIEKGISLYINYLCKQ